MGRCLNQCLREHERSIENSTASNRPLHCKDCEDHSGMPLLVDTVVSFARDAHEVKKDVNLHRSQVYETRSNVGSFYAVLQIFITC